MSWWTRWRLKSPTSCLLSGSFRRRSNKSSKLRIIGLCESNPPVTAGFPSQRASNGRNVSIWWRHHDIISHGLFSDEWQMSEQLRPIREQTTRCLIAYQQGNRVVIVDQFQVSYEWELRILVRWQDAGMRPSISDPANSGDLCWLVLHYSDVTWAPLAARRLFKTGTG